MISTPAATTSRQPGLLASIDMGSNSFRLEVAQLYRGQYKRQLYLKETVRLGAGLDADGMLTDAAMQRGLDCLRRFAPHLSGMPVTHVRAVATQTLREARNRNEFLTLAQTALGHGVEVISGREEARLIYAGVAGLQPSERTRLVIDIGGRSTEMILGRGAEPLKAESFQVGSVSLSLRFFPDGRFTPEAFRAAQVAAGAELEEALGLFSRHSARPAWQEALGSSGTVGAVAQLLEASGITDGTITPEALRWCIDHCIRAGHIDALDLPGLKDDRRAVVGGGLCILYTLLMQFGIDALTPTKGALRQGVIFDLSDRLHSSRLPGTQGDRRDLSILDLQHRFAVDTAQADRVRGLALRLYRALEAKAHKERQRELGWAAALHEMGMTVSHHDHHRHTAYLLAHVDAPGFSQNQLKRLGDLGLGQRGGLRKLEAALTEDAALLWQLLALRLAVILCHARQDAGTAALRVQRDGTTVTLKAPRGWASAHPRATYTLQQEAEAWAKFGMLQLQLQLG